MEFKEIKIGQRVVRARGSNVGLLGTVLDVENQRVQIKWDMGTKTWVNYSQIEPENIPYEIDDKDAGKFDRHGKLIHPNTEDFNKNKNQVIEFNQLKIK